ncbi:MAG: epoxyqueuosine reductase [Pirellulales bacterium]|nr:epoxyqueuosine reductase [Pirellulales bacterium]
MDDLSSRFAQLRDRLTGRGAALVAVADLQGVPSNARDEFERGVVIGVALRPEVVAQIANGPTAEYACEYERVNDCLNGLTSVVADWLASEGFRARRQPITAASVDERSLSTPLPHKTVARLAGLGWIGKCALLVNKEFGSAVRYATVLTDAPLVAVPPVDASSCGECTACVEACPARAPSGREWTPGMRREEFFDVVKCFRQTNHWAATLPEGYQHQICGMCIAACPYTRRYVDRARRPCERKS